MSVAIDDTAGDSEDVRAASAPLLATRGLTKTFGRLTALKQHSIAVRTGSISCPQASGSPTRQ